MGYTREHLSKLDLRELEAIEPESAEDCDLVRDAIKRHISRIDVQLKDPSRTDANGSKMSGDAYWNWRKGAIAAQSFARDRMGYLKRLLKEFNAASGDSFGDREERRCLALERIADALEDWFDRIDPKYLLDERSASQQPRREVDDD